MRNLFLGALLCASFMLPVQADEEAVVLPMRERAKVIDRWLDIRVKEVLPGLMRRTGIDMWVMISREYNEDPVLRTFLPSTWQSARRRTMLVIYDPGEDQPLETLAVARYNVGSVFEKAWDKEQQPDQWARLAEIITERNPQRIGINLSDDYGHADGINKTEYDLLMQALPENLQANIVSAQDLAVGWLEARSDAEMQVYPQIVRIAHDIIRQGFSEAVIQPGVTTTQDVVWWYRQRIRDLGLNAWFHPTVSIQRAQSDGEDFIAAFTKDGDGQIIIPGDLLHVDFGITYLRLNTDTQQHAYILKPGETGAPEGLQQALKNANRLQDILTSHFKTGRSGNDILARTLKQAKAEGIDPHVYSHPIGYHGHGAGPTIGLWDQQEGVPGRGDYPLYPNTAYSIELNAKTEVKGWDAPVRIMLEEDAYFDGEKVWYLDGRQMEFWLVPRTQVNAGQ